MKFVLMSLVLVQICLGMDMMLQKIVKQTEKHVLQSTCFGPGNKQKFDLAIGESIDKCMQLAPTNDLLDILSPNSQFTSLFPSVNVKNPFRQFQTYQDLDQLVSLWRNKRSVTKRDTEGLLSPDEDDFMEFLEDFDEFKGGMATKIGNLTCVMTELKMLTPELKVNIDYYTRSIEEDEEIDVTESEFLQDPEWMERLTTGYQDCYDISESIPSAALMSNPLTKVFGRQMIFFKCAKKNEHMNCALGQMKKWVEEWYGSDDNQNATEYGLPEDRYEAAALSLLVLDNAASDEEKFVGDFFWGA